jgi:hypothetical protein
MGIDLILVATAVAVLLLVVYSDKLFEENRTRVQRPRTGLGVRRTEAAPAEAPTAEGLVWRTLVSASANSTVTKLPDASLPARPVAPEPAPAERPAGQFVEIGTAA